MRIGILSDTHDALPRVQFAIQLLLDAGVERLIHCGDFIGPRILAECAVLPCDFVFGNNDADTVPELTAEAARVGCRCLGWGGEVALAGQGPAAAAPPRAVPAHRRRARTSDARSATAPSGGAGLPVVGTLARGARPERGTDAADQSRGALSNPRTVGRRAGSRE